jgi:hypothetical protein
MEEEWRDIEGYEGFYKISNLGRLLILSKNKIKKQVINSEGYAYVTISKNDIKKCFTVHRLVAKAFIPNPENKEQVNHKNKVRSDNRMENLEWNTIKENSIHRDNTNKKLLIYDKEGVTLLHEFNLSEVTIKKITIENIIN